MKCKSCIVKQILEKIIWLADPGLGAIRNKIHKTKFWTRYFIKHWRRVVGHKSTKQIFKMFNFPTRTKNTSKNRIFDVCRPSKFRCLVDNDCSLCANPARKIISKLSKNNRDNFFSGICRNNWNHRHLLSLRHQHPRSRAGNFLGLISSAKLFQEICPCPHNLYCPAQWMAVNPFCLMFVCISIQQKYGRFI